MDVEGCLLKYEASLCTLSSIASHCEVNLSHLSFGKYTSSTRYMRLLKKRAFVVIVDKTSDNEILSRVLGLCGTKDMFLIYTLLTFARTR